MKWKFYVVMAFSCKMKNFCLTTCIHQSIMLEWHLVYEMKCLVVQICILLTLFFFPNHDYVTQVLNNGNPTVDIIPFLEDFASSSSSSSSSFSSSSSSDGLSFIIEGSEVIVCPLWKNYSMMKLTPKKWYAF